MSNKIEFSPEIIQYLPMYLGITIKDFSELQNFKYSRMYLYNVVTAKMVITPMLNDELNRVWNKLGLEYADLENVYKLSLLISTGNNKLKQNNKRK
jgi:hypothetical protein